MMNPLKVELSEVESWRLILAPGTTRLELRLRLAGEGPVCAGWLWPGVTAGGEGKVSGKKTSGLLFHFLSKQNKLLTLTS